MFYRKYKDPGEKWEKVTEANVIGEISGAYINADDIINQMKNGQIVNVIFSVYAWSESGEPEDQEGLA